MNSRSGDGRIERIERIRRLLAQAERTPYPQEAEAFTAKANVLMARHHIDAAMLDDAADGDDVAVSKSLLVERGPYVAARMALLVEIAESFGGQVVYHTDWDGRHSTIIAMSSDIDTIELLYTSLLVQSANAMRRQRTPAGRSAVSWRRAFLFGFADTIGRRLRDANDAAVVDVVAADDTATSSSVDLVLLGRSERVDAKRRDDFPRLAAPSPLAPVSETAMSTGKAAGRSAVLNTAAVAAPSGAIGRGR